MAALLTNTADNARFAQLGYPLRCGELLREGHSFAHSWRQALAEQQVWLGQEEESILGRLAEVLGQSDVEGQMAALTYTRALLQKRWELAREREQKYGRLYRTMGLFSGLAVAVLLL